MSPLYTALTYLYQLALLREKRDSSTFRYSEAYLILSLGSETTGKNNFLKNLLK